MATIEIRGVLHAYDLSAPSPDSSTPVLVFIHGWLLSRLYWQPIIEQLSPRYQCLAYDLRGFGDSILRNPAPDSGYTLAHYAQDLGLLLEKLNISRTWLVGHSLGGSIALWGAEYVADRVQGVVCLNSGGGIYLQEEFERFRAAGEQLIKRRPRWLPYVPLIDLIFAQAMVARPLPRRWGYQRVLDFVRADERAALGALLDSTTEAEVHLLPQVVARLKQPVYFVAGAKDKVMEPKYVRYLASFHASFPKGSSNVIELADCGHLSMVEQPDRVAANLLGILSNSALIS
ncbi:MAG: alpha/beta hydrolase [Chloroflexaceae bacterium]|nr:alpha/beta hydrolase [Chloroflexaceae bacterium]